MTTRLAGRTAADVVTIVAGSGVLLAGARVARRGVVPPAERRWFEGLNGVSPRWYRPVWSVMQLGSLGGIALSTVAASRLADRELARRVGAAGALAWAAAKGAKRLARRGRPESLLPSARVLGRTQTGLGYPSGHAAVTAAIGATVFPQLGRARATIVLVPLAVGSARMYVGAHLPLDVIGGAALGLACAAAVDAVDGARSPAAGRLVVTGRDRPLRHGQPRALRRLPRARA